MTTAPTGTLTAAPITAAPLTAVPMTAAPITAAPSLEANGAGHGALGVADLLGTSTPTPPVGVKSKASGRGRRWIIEWALVILVAVGVAVGIRTFVVQTFFIPSGSMEPTLMVGDRILVDKLSYHLHAVHRGDIVVFAKPPGENDPNVSDLVKRVIGLPGDTISSEDGRVDIDGKPLSEPWLPAGTVTTGIQTMTIPPNEYFVMGDNRSDSQDSRFFGPISRSLIVGRVVLRIWPVSHFHVF